MNNQTEGQWKQIKGDIQRTWGKLTDDEIEKAKGNVKSLAGIIQEKFGQAQEDAAKKLNGILDKYKNGKNETDTEGKKRMESEGSHPPVN